jgi:phosphoglycolate phosphatase-like HAD superfamily hydrolase
VPTATRKPVAKKATPAKAAPKRAAAAKPAAKTKAAPKATAAKSTKGSMATERLSYADKLAMVPEVVKKLKSGVPFSQIRQEYASTGLRRALAEKGYDTSGNKIEQETISTSGGAAATAKRIAKARQDGMAFFKIELATGKTRAEIVSLLEENGFADLAHGHVSSEDEVPAKRAPAKTKAAAPKAKAAPAKKSAATVKAAPKAKSAVKRAAKPAAPAAAVKAKPRPRRVSRPQ